MCYGQGSTRHHGILGSWCGPGVLWTLGFSQVIFRCQRCVESNGSIICSRVEYHPTERPLDLPEGKPLHIKIMTTFPAHLPKLLPSDSHHHTSCSISFTLGTLFSLTSQNSATISICPQHYESAFKSLYLHTRLRSPGFKLTHCCTSSTSS